jgi:MFS family permease
VSQTLDHTTAQLENFVVEPFGVTDSSAIAAPIAPRITRRLGPDFAKLWGATAASNLSDGIRVAALPLLAAATTSDPRQIAGVAFATQAPWLVFGIASGAIVDRFERRRVIAAAHLFRMIVVALLALFVWTGGASILALYAAAFLLGTAETLFDNASQVIVPEIVNESQLERAHGRQTMAMLSGQHLIGPLLGAALFSMATPAPFVIDVVVLCLAALLVLGIKRRPPVAQPARTTTIRLEIAESVRWLWGQRTLRRISLAAAAVNIAVMAHIAIFVLFCLEVLDVSGVGYALILACYAVGGIAGGWVAPRLTASLGWRTCAMLALAVGGLSILITGLTSSALLTAVMQMTLGVAASLWLVVTCSLRQRLTPEHMLGRVTGAHALLAWGGAALGALAGGFVAATFGLRAPFLAGGVVLLLLTVGIATLPVEREQGPCPA